jgi:hypothetical protein
MIQSDLYEIPKNDARVIKAEEHSEGGACRHEAKEQYHSIFYIIEFIGHHLLCSKYDL